MKTAWLQVAVVGCARCSMDEGQAADDLGRRLALAEAELLCGGRAGIVGAACRGARLARGTSVGILPGKVIESGDRGLSVCLPTGMEAGRNGLLVACAHSVIAIGGGDGTLSEIALALKAGRQVIGLATSEAESPAGGRKPGLQAQSPAEPAEAALAAALTVRRPGGWEEAAHRRT
ncbi:MAG: hypothetical protein MUO23_03135 [Anaerolineales bacterium]|nr:hypothetical protein [Anaerolineales bacterium]